MAIGKKSKVCILRHHKFSVLFFHLSRNQCVNFQQIILAYGKTNFKKVITLKKLTILVCLIISLIIAFPLTTYATEPPDNSKAYPNNFNNPPTGSKEELYRDIFITLLYPHINRAIGDYYSQYLKYLPGEDPWSIKILDIEREKAFEFIVNVEAMPYIGPHNSVGTDHITFRILLFGGIKLEKYEHIQSFSIPPNYQDIIIKWPPK